MNYNWNWSIFWQLSPDGSGTYLDMLLSGLGWTIITAILAWFVAIVFGSIVGIMLSLRSKLANLVSAAYVEIFRNIPLLLQLFIWYFVLPELLPEYAGDFLKQMPNAAFWTSAIGIGLYMSARIAVLLQAGINSLSSGQEMAAKALGLTTTQTYLYVVLPIAFRIIFPPLTSEFLNTIKNTSVAFTIGLLELTGQARTMQEFSFQTFEAFTAATLFYLMLNLIVVLAMRMIERRSALPCNRMKKKIADV